MSAETQSESKKAEQGDIPRVHSEYQYLTLLRRLMQDGVEQVDKGTGVKTYSLFAEKLVFDLKDGLPLLTTKRVYWEGLKHELYWFWSGQSNIKYLVDNGVHIWDDYPFKIYNEKARAGKVPTLSKEDFIRGIKEDVEFAKIHGELPNIYGELWRRLPAKDGRTIDQIAWVLNEMIEDPDAHNLIVDSWYPEYLYSMALPGEASRFPICHNLFQLNVKNGEVHLQLYQRSADIFLGVPFNIGSYAALTHVFAHLSGYRPGTFTHIFGDVHIYENHFNAANEQLTRTPRDFPRLRIDPTATTIDNFRPEHLILEGYHPHPTIKAALTAAGGYRDTSGI